MLDCQSARCSILSCLRAVIMIMINQEEENGLHTFTTSKSTDGEDRIVTASQVQNRLVSTPILKLNASVRIEPRTLNARSLPHESGFGSMGVSHMTYAYATVSWVHLYDCSTYYADQFIFQLHHVCVGVFTHRTGCTRNKGSR